MLSISHNNGSPRALSPTLLNAATRRPSGDQRLDINLRHPSLVLHRRPISNFKNPVAQHVRRSNFAPRRLEPLQRDITDVLMASTCLWASNPFPPNPIPNWMRLCLIRSGCTPAQFCLPPPQSIDFSDCPPQNPRWVAGVAIIMGGPEEPHPIVRRKPPPIEQRQSSEIGLTGISSPPFVEALLTNDEELEDLLPLSPALQRTTHRQEGHPFFPSSRVIEDKDEDDSLPLAVVSQRKRKQESASDDEIEIVGRLNKKQRISASSKTLQTSYSDSPSPSEAETSLSPTIPTPQPNSATQKSSNPRQSWSKEEEAMIQREVLALRADEENSGIPRTEWKRDMHLWEYISERLATHGFFRKPLGCKNYWNRRGRALSGCDERLNPNPNQLATSVQLSRKGRPGSH